MTISLLDMLPPNTLKLLISQSQKTSKNRFICNVLLTFFHVKETSAGLTTNCDGGDYLSICLTYNVIKSTVQNS